MHRWALLLEYDGGPFVGWQRQGAGISVQAVLEAAAAKLNGNAPVATVVAGRTDAGVHAEGQVAQLELARALSAIKLRDALNYHMKPHPVVVLRAAGAARRACLASAGPVGCRGDACGGTDAAGAARFFLVPRGGLPGEISAAHA
jgi:tRNA U38,U39,U40 pseudouridine synthase TruA